MDTERELAMERRIHEMLCGDLDGDGREDLLVELVHDPDARALLDEMVDTLRQARRACGIDAGRRELDRFRNRLRG